MAAPASTSNAAAISLGRALVSMISDDTDDDDASLQLQVMSTSTAMMNDDEISVRYTMNHLIAVYGYPILRLAIALLVIYVASGVSS
jgi:hypothetical protein